jgi:hypothetical protein
MLMVSAADSALAMRYQRYEVNPLVKHHPGVATGIGFGIDGAVMVLSRHYKRQDDAMRAAGIPMDPRGDHRWWAFPAVVTVIRSAGLITDLVATSVH